jgi:hypothetical protein
MTANAMVRLTDVPKVLGYDRPEDIAAIFARALEETAYLEALTLIHGRDRGITRYYSFGGTLFYAPDGHVWIAVEITPRRERRTVSADTWTRNDSRSISSQG